METAAFLPVRRQTGKEPSVANREVLCRSRGRFCASSQTSVYVDFRRGVPSRLPYCIHQIFGSSLLKRQPSCFLRLAIFHLLLKGCAEVLETRLEKTGCFGPSPGDWESAFSEPKDTPSRHWHLGTLQFLEH